MTAIPHRTRRVPARRPGTTQTTKGTSGRESYAPSTTCGEDAHNLSVLAASASTFKPQGVEKKGKKRISANSKGQRAMLDRVIQHTATVSLSSSPPVTSEETARQTDAFLSNVEKELGQWVVDFCGTGTERSDLPLGTGPSSDEQLSTQDRVDRITTILKEAARTHAAALGDESYTGELGTNEALALTERKERRQRLRPEDALYHNMFDEIDAYLSAIDPFWRASCGGAGQELLATIGYLGVEARMRRWNEE